MPLEDTTFDELSAQGYVPYGMPAERDNVAPGPLETLEAAYATSNWVYGAFTGGGEPFPAASKHEQLVWANDRFNQYEYVAKNYPEFAGDDAAQYFHEMMTPAQVDWQVKRLTREGDARRTLSEAPWYYSFPFGAAAELTNPTEVLFNVGTLPVGASRLAASLALRNVGGLGSGEMILHDQQAMRTPVESSIIVGAGGVFGAGVGGVIGTASRRGVAEGTTPVVRAAEQASIAQRMPTGTAGAARVDLTDEIPTADMSRIAADPNLTPKEKAVAMHEAQASMYAPLKEGALQKASLGTYKLLPEVRMLMSPFAAVKGFANTVMNHPLINRLKTEQRHGPSVEAKWTRNIERNNAAVPHILKKEYTAYKKTAQKPDRMDMGEFEHNVRLAMTKQDTSDIPQVEAAARQLRKIADEYTDRLVRAGALADDAVALGDTSWFIRSYNPEWFRRTELERVYEEFLPGMRRHADEALAEQEAAIRKEVDELAQELEDEGDITGAIRIREEGLTDVENVRIEFDEQAKQQLKGMREELAFGKVGDASFMSPGVRQVPGGALQLVKARTLGISTADVPRAALATDVSGALSRSLDRMEKLLSVTEDVRLGDPTFANVHKKLIDEYEDRLALAKEKGQDTAKLSKEFERAKTEIDKTAMALYGVTPAQDTIRNFTTGIKAYNAISDLGRVIFSVPGELWGAVSSPVGFGGILRQGLLDITRNPQMKAMKKSLKEHFAFGEETAAGSRLSDLGDYDAGLSGPTRAIQKVADFAVDKAFGLGIWTRHRRLATGVSLASHIGDLARKSKLTKQDKIDLGRIGVREKIWEDVRREVAKHGEEIGVRSMDPHMAKWDNQELADEIATAIHGETYNLIIKPGIGSRPWATYDPMVSLISQYRSFTLAATSKYYLAGVQRVGMGDPRPLFQFALMSSTAALATNLRQMTYATERRREFTMEDYIREGVTMGATFGVLTDINALMGATTGGQWDAFRLTGMDPQVMTKFQGTRTVTGAIGGATLGTFTDIAKALGAISKIGTDEEITRGDIGALRRVFPFNNYAPISYGASKLEDRLYDSIGGQ